jgi:hypothetical protein
MKTSHRRCAVSIPQRRPSGLHQSGDDQEKSGTKCAKLSTSTRESAWRCGSSPKPRNSPIVLSRLLAASTLILVNHASRFAAVLADGLVAGF